VLQGAPAQDSRRLALDHGLASQGRHIVVDGPFRLQVPSDHLNVQHFLDDDPDISENEYEAVTCLACSKLHLINRKTGKLLGQDDD
jgi:hypothetical protein